MVLVAGVILSDSPYLPLFALVRAQDDQWAPQGMLGGYPPGTLPEREVQWMAAQCYNRGVRHAKFYRYSEADRFMSLGCEILAAAG